MGERINLISIDVHCITQITPPEPILWDLFRLLANYLLLFCLALSIFPTLLANSQRTNWKSAEGPRGGDIQFLLYCFTLILRHGIKIYDLQFKMLIKVANLKFKISVRQSINCCSNQLNDFLVTIIDLLLFLFVTRNRLARFKIYRTILTCLN